jgi:4-amino-4-deoxy-L-arabinose transferase-like glycosyltransferase
MLSIKAKTGLAQGNSPNQYWLRFIPLAVVFLVAVAVLFGKLGDFPLFNPDEGYYAEPAREMLVTGEYVTTPLNYVVRYTKPPLIMWAMIFCYKLFGINEFAARFFGAACGVSLVLATYLFLEKFLGNRIAIIGGLSLITAPLYFGVAREAITDMPLSLFTAGSLMAFFIAFKERNQVLKWLGYVLVGLAVMTKGPVGALLPGLIMFIFYLLRGQAANAMTFFQLPIGCLVVSLIALPWFITEIVVTNGAYFREFILRENFERFTSVVDAHKGGWWYHLAAIFGGFLPWSIFLPQAIVRFFRDTLQEISKSNIFSRQFLTEVQVRLWTVSQTEEICLFAICWSFITVAFFSASVSKLLPYTLPAFPALAMLVSIEIERCIMERKKIGLLIPLAVLAVVYGAGMVFSPQLLSNLKDAPVGLSSIISSAATFLFVSTLIALALIWKNLKRPAIWLFAASFLFLITFYGQQMLPTISAAWEGKIPAYAQYAARSKDSIVVFDLRKPGIPFYTKRKVIQPADRKELNTFLSKTNRAYIITKTKNIPSLETTKGFSVVASDNKFALLLWQRTI